MPAFSRYTAPSTAPRVPEHVSIAEREKRRVSWRWSAGPIDTADLCARDQRKGPPPQDCLTLLAETSRPRWSATLRTASRHACRRSRSSSSISTATYGGFQSCCALRRSWFRDRHGTFRIAGSLWDPAATPRAAADSRRATAGTLISLATSRRRRASWGLHTGPEIKAPGAGASARGLHCGS